MHDELCLRFHSIGWRLAGLSTDSAKGFFWHFWSILIFAITRQMHRQIS